MEPLGGYYCTVHPSPDAVEAVVVAGLLKAETEFPHRAETKLQPANFEETAEYSRLPTTAL
jgi:hypothetical protein